jgi:iron complex outermembrane receptor protein
VEVRLASKLGTPLQYLAGFYYLRTRPGAALTPQTATTNEGGTLVYDIQELPGSTIAGFGQVTYSLTPRFRMTGGLRVSNDKISESNSYTLDGAAGTASTFHQSQTSVQYKGGVEYDVAPRSLFYADVATGFKQGGISPTFPSIPFKPEHLTSFEAGLKNRFFDNRLQINLAAFYYLYRNYQFQVFETLQIGTQDATANFPVIGNAGKSHIGGAEAEVDYLPWRNGHLHGSLTYLDAKYGTVVLPNSPFANQGLYDLKGHQIQNAPHWAANVGFDQDFDVGPGKITASVNTHLTTGYYVTPEQYLPGARQGGFTRTDLFLRYVAPKDRWTIGGFLKNAEGKAQTTYVFPLYRRFVTAPRTFGLTAGVTF